jgi:hypothetical protein
MPLVFWALTLFFIAILPFNQGPTITSAFYSLVHVLPFLMAATTSIWFNYQGNPPPDHRRLDGASYERYSQGRLMMGDVRENSGPENDERKRVKRCKPLPLSLRTVNA